ncbi:unnamed protein product [Darwinula stevensoni]|uniref:Laccase n=1 Tax=Darwinula stevensoni TaxID=69355 RepID=A0A7R8XC29_9CRUS|nr:unnamed protein product [Darwinula stevensoni]CAG0892122.1 unnamed protein product [Darwinula stevensoni]
MGHECERECRLGDTRICKYEFHLELYHTLSRACHGCPNVTADCYRPDCISGDGRPRPVTVVNRRLPGPAIQVCEGDEIQVLVKNGLISETTTIHWHGIHQSGPGAAWMDGVPHVTQCPILPGTSFLYSFRAHPAGSHFWHSHSGVQRGDGVYGALAVRRARIADPLASHYDEDADFLVLADWLPETSVANFASHHHASGDNKPDGILVNGRGWPPRAFPYRPSPFRPVASLPPLANVTVKPGKRHRIRVIGNGVLNCPLEMLIDDHPLTVVATDGFPVRPFVVDSFVVYAGERTDVVVKADREPGTYWIRIRGHIDCGVNFTRASQVALLVYEGAESLSSPFPSSPVGFRYFPLPNRTYNGVNEGPGKVEEGRWTASETTWIGNDGDLDPAWRKPDPDRFFLLTFDFYPVPHSSFYHQEHYPVGSRFPPPRRDGHANALVDLRRIRDGGRNEPETIRETRSELGEREDDRGSQTSGCSPDGPLRRMPSPRSTSPLRLEDRVFDVAAGRRCISRTHPPRIVSVTVFDVGIVVRGALPHRRGSFLDTVPQIGRPRNENDEAVRPEGSVASGRRF